MSGGVPDDVSAAVEQALGSSLSTVTQVGGGDINEAARITTRDGSRYFLKYHRTADSSMFPAEAHGLAWLAEAGALPTPEVVAVSAEGGDTNWLVLGWLEAAAPCTDHDERLGRGLAALHGSRPETFGLERDNFIGSLPQDNEAATDWTTFYRDRRLAPQIERATAAGLIPTDLRRQCDLLLDRLDDFVGPTQAPSRLHGDLWRGNVHRDASGQPVLIDPAVYGGHREMDLAMMRLFGGFSDRVFAAYEEAFPTADGAGERLPLYQLYPLLVHVNLFGGGYVGSVARAVRRFVS